MSDTVLQDALNKGEQFKAALQAGIDAKVKATVATSNETNVWPILPAADVFTPHWGVIKNEQ